MQTPTNPSKLSQQLLEHEVTSHLSRSRSLLQLNSPGNASEIIGAHKVLPLIKTPSMDSVEPAQLITNALTPKRDLDVDGDNDYYSPAGFNRTYFSREAYQRRRITEVHVKMTLFD
ncbi:hypothetical protein DICVIV_14148 [Dictyocaulus viviparus]|uniref:Uncharacterized protein n=1 Tax=Dictyocaulus viviparus TaxID=29172 RepID=A0A0D8X8H8_DICVI|nr:hypothetical protein DICVIV_14148 [Dictyocaulus viviparus]